MIGAFYKNRHFDLCRINKFVIIQNLPFNFGLSRVRIIEEHFLEVKLYKNGLLICACIHFLKNLKKRGPKIALK